MTLCVSWLQNVFILVNFNIFKFVKPFFGYKETLANNIQLEAITTDMIDHIHYVGLM